MQKYPLDFNFGDWSQDGHGKISTVHVDSSHPSDAVVSAYYLGSHQLGFRLDQQVAESYQDSTIQEEHLEQLTDLGWTPRPGFDSYSLLIEDLWSMLVFVIHLGNPEINLEVVERKGFFEEHALTFGYGLFD